MLDLTRHFSALERADDGIQQLVVRRIQTVQNGAGQLARFLQRVQHTGHSLAAIDSVDHVVTGVRAELRKHFLVGVAQTIIVQLHHPAHAVVFFCHEEHECSFIL